MNRKWIIGAILVLLIVAMIVLVLYGLGLLRIRARIENELYRDPQEVCFAIRANLPDEAVLRILAEKPHLLNLPASDGSTPLHVAVAANRNAIAARLLELGAYVDARKPDRAGGFTPLLSAIARNNDEAVSLLLEHGANAELGTSDGVTPMELAERLAHQRIVNMLREHLGK